MFIRVRRREHILTWTHTNQAPNLFEKHTRSCTAQIANSMYLNDSERILLIERILLLHSFFYLYVIFSSFNFQSNCLFFRSMTDNTLYRIVLPTSMLKMLKSVLTNSDKIDRLLV